MSSLLSSPFQDDSINEVVPMAAKIAGKLSQASVITARRRVRLQPQGGQNYTLGAGSSSNSVNILFQDGQSYVDLLSAVLSFDISVTGGGCLDDGAYSVFRRALVSVNSTIQDDVDFIAKKANAELYATASQGFYDNVGSFMGLWAKNTAAYGTNGVTTAAVGTSTIGTNGYVDKYSVVEKGKIAAANCVGGAASKARFMVPVSMLSSFFRNETLFPLRNSGQLYLQLNLAALGEAVCLDAGTATAVNITNLTCEVDYVDLHPTYVSMMDEIMERPDGEGVRWAYDSTLVAAQNIPAQDGQTSVIVSKASQNMRAIQILVQPTAGLAAQNYPAQSTFCNPGAVDVQYRVGSLLFPTFPSLGAHRQFADLQLAFGRVASVDKSGIVDIQNFYNASNVAAMSLVAPYSGGMGQAGVTPNAQLYSDCWMHAYCFDKLKAATYSKDGTPDLDGLNTLSSSGSQIVVQLNANANTVLPATPLTLTAILRFTRVFEIRGGATRVIG